MIVVVIGSLSGKPETEMRGTLLKIVSLMLCLSAAQHGFAEEDADFKRAHGYYTAQEYQRAAESFGIYLRDYPKSERAEQGMLLLAESRYQQKQFVDAAKDYERFNREYALSARRPEALLRLAKIYLLLKQHEKGLAVAESFLKDGIATLGDPAASASQREQFGSGYYYAGEHAFALKQSNKARAYWLELIKSTPQSSFVSHASDGLGWLHFEAEEFEMALRYFQYVAALPNHPQAARAKLMEGRALAALKRYEPALLAFTAAPKLSGSNKNIEAEALLRSAETLEAAGRADEAFASFKRLGSEFPALPITAQSLAAAANRASAAARHADAAALIDVFMALPGDQADRLPLQRLKARSLAAAGDPAQALQAARKAAEDASQSTHKAQEHPAALALLAELSGAQGTEYYKELVENYPQSRFGLIARYELSRILGLAGRNDEALAQLQTLLQALEQHNDPGNPPELRANAYFAAAEYAFRKADYAKSEEFVKAYRKLAGDTDGHGDDTARKLAWCRYHLGDTAAAIKLIDASIERYPASATRAEMVYLRALANGKSGATDDALKGIDTLLRDYPASTFGASARLLKASLLRAGGHEKEAEETLSEIADQPEVDGKKSPEARLTLIRRGVLRFDMRRFLEAKADLSILGNEINPEASAEEIQALLRLALCHRELKETVQAKEVLEKLDGLKLKGSTAFDVAFHLGNIAFDGNEFPAAIEQYRRALALPESSGVPKATRAAAQLNLAWSLKRFNSTDDAERAFAEVPRIDADGGFAAEALYERGRILMESGKQAEAVALWKMLLEGPHSATPHAARARERLKESGAAKE